MNWEDLSTQEPKNLFMYLARLWPHFLTTASDPLLLVIIISFGSHLSYFVFSQWASGASLLVKLLEDTIKESAINTIKFPKYRLLFKSLLTLPLSSNTTTRITFKEFYWIIVYFLPLSHVTIKTILFSFSQDRIYLDSPLQGSSKLLKWYLH